jgi:hypothetical protein
MRRTGAVTTRRVVIGVLVALVLLTLLVYLASESLQPAS